MLPIEPPKKDDKDDDDDPLMLLALNSETSIPWDVLENKVSRMLLKVDVAHPLVRLAGQKVG